jgi:hypothetical protein
MLEDRLARLDRIERVLDFIWECDPNDPYIIELLNERDELRYGPMKEHQ